MTTVAPTNIISRTRYVNNFIYENNVLKRMLFEEGVIEVVNTKSPH